MFTSDAIANNLNQDNKPESSYQQYFKQGESVNSMILEGDDFLEGESTITFSYNGQSSSLSRCEKSQPSDNSLVKLVFESNEENPIKIKALPGRENEKTNKKLKHALPAMKPEKDFMEKELYTQNQIKLKDCSFSEASFSEDVSNPEIFF